MMITTIDIPELTEKDKSRFWGKVDKKGLGRCWEWVGSKVHSYGRLKISGKNYYAHRVAWFLANGPIPSGKFVCHSCDNHFCCYEEHFFLGTQKENMQDAAEKGRMAKGEKHANRKVTKLIVLEIRKRYSEGETQLNIAKDYEIGQTQISNIVRRKQWTHV